MSHPSQSEGDRRSPAKDGRIVAIAVLLLLVGAITVAISMFLVRRAKDPPRRMTPKTAAACGRIPSYRIST